jgi:hypothetical protein
MQAVLQKKHLMPPPLYERLAIVSQQRNPGSNSGVFFFNLLTHVFENCAVHIGLPKLLPGQYVQLM